MSDYPSRDWGSIPDWIQVLFVVLTPLFDVLLRVLAKWESPWTIFAAALLALISSLAIVVVLGRIRATPIRTFTQALKARILSDSRQGALNRLLLGLIAGTIVLVVLYSAGRLTQNWSLAMATTAATWLVLSMASAKAQLRKWRVESRSSLDKLRTDSNESLSKLRDSHRGLQAEFGQFLERVANLEGAVFSYPDGESDWIPRCDFWSRLDTEVLEMSGLDTHEETASCLGVQHSAIYQHPPGDGDSDAILRFERQPQVAGQAVLTFYTGIEDARLSASGEFRKSGLIPKGGNRVRFEVYANGRRVFQETRNTFEWRFHALLLPSLPPTAPYGYEIEFRTNACGDPRWNWAVWGEPRLAELGIVFEELEELRRRIERPSERGQEK